MKITRQIIALTFLALTNLLSAQTVEIIRKSGTPSPTTDKDFAFIEPTIDTTALKFIATIKVTGKDMNANLETLYKTIKDKSHELGANCFKFNNYIRQDTLNTLILVLDTYSGNDSILNVNFLKHEKNVVYIFGNEKKSNETYSFKIDNIKQEIKSGTFYKHQIKEAQEVKINKGGFTGATIWIKWKENKAATFLTLTGFGLGGMPNQQTSNGSAGLSFNTGRINYLDGNLGHLFLLLLKQSN